MYSDNNYFIYAKQAKSVSVSNKGKVFDRVVRRYYVYGVVLIDCNKSII